MSNVSPGSLDVSPYADEAGEPAHAQQRPLGAGLRPPAPGQEAPAAALRNLGRERVTSHKAVIAQSRRTDVVLGLDAGYFPPRLVGEERWRPLLSKQTFMRTHTEAPPPRGPVFFCFFFAL